MKFFAALWLLLFNLAIFNFPSGLSKAQEGAEVSSSSDPFANWTDPISRTVVRLFQSQGEYHAGDLIVRSQVAEIQEYLRKTQGASFATNPRLRNRVLKDQDPLARAFYGSGGDRLLREASIKVGGYGPLDRLCQMKSGRDVIATTIRHFNLEMLVEYTLKRESSLESTESSSVAVDKNQRRRIRGKIYTVVDLLKALHPEGMVQGRSGRNKSAYPLD